MYFHQSFQKLNDNRLEFHKFIEYSYTSMIFFKLNILQNLMNI